MKKYISAVLMLLISFASLASFSIFADPELISVFPLDRYDQTVSNWIKSNDPNYDKSLLTADMQQQHWQTFNKHYFGSLSPWNSDYINKILHQTAPDDLKSIEQTIIDTYSNQNKPDDQIGYGENFRPHSPYWIEHIAANINLSQFDHFVYQPNHRAIAIDNLAARVLPTDDVHFYSYKLAGQGYPFDNLQMSSLWAGTPVYILGVSRNHAWSLVVTPDYIGWVKSDGLARVSDSFIKTWETASQKQLAAITHTRTELLDKHGQLLFTAYVGSVFPVVNDSKLMVPVADMNQFASIQLVPVATHDIALMPLSATPHHFADVMQTLIHRPYGWGNMYFYNDCSAELKSLLTPFGIWLPRHSSDQVYAGKLVDVSAAPKEQRLAYLENNGHPFTTIIYIGGHVIMYVGNYPNPNSSDHELMAMTYQNVWGLSPSPSIRRAVIGKSVLFPMLLQYPEDATLVSLADKKYFQVSYLDQPPSNILKLNIIDLRALMHP
jgi:cell wall-associated NlpC family hydrolase